MRILFVPASVVLVLFLILPNKIEPQKRKAARVIEGTISNFECGDNCYLTIIDKNGKEHTGLCLASICNPWTAVQTMPPRYKGRNVRATLGKGKQYNAAGKVMGTADAFTSIQILEATTRPSTVSVLTSQQNPAPAMPPRQDWSFAGEWSNETSRLTIIRNGNKFTAVYPTAKDVEVLHGEVLANNQLRLRNDSVGKIVNPFESYAGDFDREAWIELGGDGSFVTVRFNQEKGGRSIVMKRIAGTVASSISETSTVTWASVSAGSSYACAVTTTGAPYCWGHGHGDITSDEVFGSPGLVQVIDGMNVAMVSAGADSACWLTTGGAAYCSGGNDYGQLGNGRGSTGIQHGRDSAAPVAVKGGLRFSLVSVGKNHTCGLTSDGVAYCWGDNRSEQLGNIDKVWTTNDSQFIDNRYGTKSEESAVPFAVGGGLRFTTLSAGAAHTCALTTAGTAYCWGEGGHGELGNGATARSARPVAVAGGLTFASLTASNTESFTCGLTKSGAAYCWGLVGDNDNLQLGNGRTGSSSVPVAVAGGLTFSTLSAGAEHVCGITTGGAAYCWGRGGWGNLGTGATKDALTPVPVAGALRFASISSGGTHTCGVTTGGVLYCWGSNGYGELGGATTARNSLVPVAPRMQPDNDGFKAFFREFCSAVRKRDRTALELTMSPAIKFPVEVGSPSMAFDYLGYNDSEGWKQLDESVTTGTKPHKDSSPQPVARVTNDNWVLFARGADGKWRWLRFGIP